jgi:hypothetical protein
MLAIARLSNCKMWSCEGTPRTTSWRQEWEADTAMRRCAATQEEAGLDVRAIFRWLAQRQYVIISRRIYVQCQATRQLVPTYAAGVRIALVERPHPERTLSRLIELCSARGALCRRTGACSRDSCAGGSLACHASQESRIENSRVLDT